MMMATGARVRLLDASSVINFAACGLLVELANYRGRFHIVDLVADEALFVRRGGSDEDVDDRIPIDLSLLVERELLQIESQFNEEELATFIDLAINVDDGEALTLAVAEHRGYVFVSDDRKAMRIAADRGLVDVATSLELIRDWIEAQRLSTERSRRILVDLYERGRYIPPRSHPLREWWESVVKTEK